MVYGSVYAAQGSVLEGVEPVFYDEDLSFMEMGALAVEEATNDWNQFMRAVALTELSYVVESGGEELIYEAVDIRTMADKVIAWFKKLWAKIKGIAETALAKFMSFGKNDQAFISKFSQKIYDGANNMPEGFSYKGWKFNKEAMNPSSGFPAKIKSLSAEYVAGAEGSAKFFGDKGTTAGAMYADMHTEKSYNTKLDRYRSALAGTTVSGASDFNKAFHRHLYGSDSKEYINKSEVDAKSLINCVSGAKEAIEGAKSGRDEIKRSLDESIDKVNSFKEKVNNRPTDDDDTEKRNDISKIAAALTNISQYLKSIQSTNATAYSAYIGALRDQNRQSKAICVKLVSYSQKEVKLGESYSSYEGGSILSSRFADVIM